MCNTDVMSRRKSNLILGKKKFSKCIEGYKVIFTNGYEEIFLVEVPNSNLIGKCFDLARHKAQLDYPRLVIQDIKFI